MLRKPRIWRDSSGWNASYSNSTRYFFIRGAESLDKIGESVRSAVETADRLSMHDLRNIFSPAADDRSGPSVTQPGLPPSLLPGERSR